VLVANLTRPVLHGVSVRVIGIRLGLQFSKTDDKRGNANGVETKGFYQSHLEENTLLLGCE
jgi:hypothetical protein